MRSHHIRSEVQHILTQSLHELFKVLIAHHLPSPVIIGRHGGAVSEAVWCVSEVRKDPRLNRAKSGSFISGIVCVCVTMWTSVSKFNR